MPNRCRICALILASFAIATSSAAFTIDFDDLSTGPVVGGALVVDVGGIAVTFSGTALEIVRIQDSPFPGLFPGTGNQITAGFFFGPLTIEIESGFSFDFVQIENHINGEESVEVDIISGQAFSAMGLLVDSFQSSIELPTLAGSGITRVSFEAPETAFVVDNVTFSIAPELSSSLLIPVGLAGLSAWGRSKHKKRPLRIRGSL